MSSWLETALDNLSRTSDYVYRCGQSSASEPAALAALALTVHGRDDQARQPLQWLANSQQSSGAVGVRTQSTDPHWPTALAILAWRLADERNTAAINRWNDSIERAVVALLRLKGEAGRHTRDMIGHDPSLVAWSWVVSTHSWVEPTALAVMALKAAGHWNHVRVREGVRLLLDRQLTNGGCNYGNTTVLGQQLRAHAQPTGMALLALGGETSDPRTTRSLDYLKAHWQQDSAPSLAWSLLGLMAHREWPPEVEMQLEQVATSAASNAFATYHWSLLALAARGPENPLVRMCGSAGSVP
jgi:hypothetical protein